MYTIRFLTRAGLGSATKEAEGNQIEEGNHLQQQDGTAIHREIIQVVVVHPCGSTCKGAVSHVLDGLELSSGAVEWHTDEFVQGDALEGVFHEGNGRNPDKVLGHIIPVNNRDEATRQS